MSVKLGAIFGLRYSYASIYLSIKGTIVIGRNNFVLLSIWLFLGSNVLAAPAVQAPPASRPITDKWALVIGISKYQDQSLNLTYPAKDAKDFYNYLIGEGNFAPDHVKLLINEQATREKILSNLGDSWLPRLALKDDLVVIFISSHGSPSKLDVGGLNYIVAYNTNPKELYATGIPIQELASIIKERVHSNRVAVILDACHSGAAAPAAKGLSRQANFDANQVAVGSGQLVICSSEPGQVSWESQNYPNSVFSHQLINTLSETTGTVNLVDCFNKMKRRVEAEVARDRGESQTPVLKSKWQGEDLCIAVKPTDPRPGLPELPQETISAGSQVQNGPARDANASLTSAAPLPIVPQESAKSAQATLFLPPTVAVLRPVGPLKISIKGWKNENELPDLPGAVQAQVAGALSRKFGRPLVDLKQTARLVSSPRSEEQWRELGHQLNARYLIAGTVNDVEWVGRVMTGNDYRLVCSVQVISGETGRVLWHLDGYSVKRNSWVKDQMLGMTKFFELEVAPDMGDDLANQINQALSAQPN
jgi:uncharacterized caspase-like protein